MIYRFAGFVADPSNQILWHGGRPVKLTPPAFRVLECLLESRGESIDAQALLDRTGDRGEGGPSRLEASIEEIRQVLRDPAGFPVIETVPGRGYRVAGNVQADATIVAPASPGTLMNHPDQPSTSGSTEAYPGNELFHFQTHPHRRSHWPLTIGLLFIAGGAALFFFSRRNRPEPLPVVLNRRQLTHSSHEKLSLALGPAGREGWFSEPDGKLDLWHLDLANGSLRRLSGDAAASSLVQAVSPDGQYLLVTRFTDHAGKRTTGLWETDTNGVNVRLLVPNGWSGAWSPDGRQLIYSLWNDHGIYRADANGGHAERIARIPGYPWYLHWSPEADRVLAISVGSPHPAAALPEGPLYRVMAQTGRMRLIQDDTGHPVEGANPYVSADQRHILFTHRSGNIDNVWEVNRHSGHLLAVTANRENTRLAAMGPAPDQIITAVEAFHARLMRLLPGSHHPQAFPEPIETRDMAFSRDGRWMAYIDLEGALCRARADGSQPVRLLAPKWNASQPVWAPDSRQLIVSATPQSGLKKLYRLLAMGTSPHPEPNAITFGMGADRDASWAANQKHVLFRRTISGVSQLEWLDLDSGRLQTVSDSHGKYAPALSSGGMIAAIDRTGHTLFLRRSLASEWETVLTDPNGVQNALWSRDGHTLYLLSGTAPGLWKRYEPRNDRVFTVADLGAVSPWAPNHWNSLALTPDDTLVVSYDVSGSAYDLLTLGDDQ